MLIFDAVDCVTIICMQSKEKILVVQADITLGRQIIDSLTKRGYQAVLVSTGSEGLKAMETGPDLVLLDVTFPDKSGYEVLASKQTNQAISKIPVFLTSSQGLPINMRDVPPGSVEEFVMALHLDPRSVVEKIDRHFGHEDDAVLSASDQSGPKKKLVWAEDDKLIGTILAKKLISSGFDLFHAKNGQEALDALKTAIPDVIALDLMLPGMSGFDILQSIRMDERLKKVPVIILSNLSKPSDLEKARVLGAQKFLVKAAVSLDQIVAEIKALCK